MRRSIVVLFLVLAALAVAAEDYTPLTLEEARQYIAEHPDLAAADIVKLDAIEHALPIISMPTLAVAIAGRDASVSWPDPIDIQIAGGALHYLATPAPILVPGIVPAPAWWEKPLWGVGGIVVGTFLTVILFAITK